MKFYKRYEATYIRNMDATGYEMDQQTIGCCGFKARSLSEAHDLAVSMFPSTNGCGVLSKEKWMEGFSDWEWHIMGDAIGMDMKVVTNAFWIILQRNPVPIKYRLETVLIYFRRAALKLTHKVPF